jgi:hypothetical protein
MTRYWIGVASREHVRAAEAGGFCQFCHGKEALVQQLAAGDGVIYYSPRESMGKGVAVRAFTAIGRVQPGAAYKTEQSACFRPWRRDVEYRPSQDAPIFRLLAELSFSAGNANWGWHMRKGFFGITEADFNRIATAMNATGLDVGKPISPNAI